MKMDQFKEKVKGFCSRVGKRNFIIIGALVLIAAAVAINVAVFSNAKDDGYNYDQSAGMDGSNLNTDTQTPADTETSVDSYFSSVQLSRQRSRDEAIEVLQSVVDNESSTATAKDEALAEIQKLALVMETEANIESLIVAKGFEECVAVINGDSASIVVKSEGLVAAQISQTGSAVRDTRMVSPMPRHKSAPMPMALLIVPM